MVRVISAVPFILGRLPNYQSSEPALFFPGREIFQMSLMRDENRVFRNSI